MSLLTAFSDCKYQAAASKEQVAPTGNNRDYLSFEVKWKRRELEYNCL